MKHPVYIYIYTHTHTHTHTLIECFLHEQILLKSKQLVNYDKYGYNSVLGRQAATSDINDRSCKQVLKELSVYAYSLKITQGQAFQQPYLHACIHTRH